MKCVHEAGENVKRMFLRWGVPVFGAALALFLTFLLYGSLDFAKFLNGLRSADPVWIAVLITTILLEQLLNGWKWRQILHDVKPVGTIKLTGALLAGYGANVLVPLGISPLIRAWIIARLERLKMPTVLTTTIISRFVDGVVFALFAGVLALAGKVPQVEGNLELGLSIAGALNIALFGGLLWAMFRFRTFFAADGPRFVGFLTGWQRGCGRMVLRYAPRFVMAWSGRAKPSGELRYLSLRSPPSWSPPPISSGQVWL